MTAMILPFSARANERRAEAANNLAPVIEQQWADRHLPMILVALELLEAEDLEFEGKCRALMRTEHGQGLLVELSENLERTSASLGLIVDAIAMTRMRLQRTIAAVRPQA